MNQNLPGCHHIGHLLKALLANAKTTEDEVKCQPCALWCTDQKVRGSSALTTCVPPAAMARHAYG